FSQGPFKAFGPVQNLAFSPDGKFLVSERLDGKEILIWDSGSGQVVHELPSHAGLTELTFTADGKELVTNDGDTLKYWDLGSGKKRRETMTNTINPAFSPDGASFVCRSAQGLVVHDAATLQPLKVLDGYPRGSILWPKKAPSVSMIISSTG